MKDSRNHNTKWIWLWLAIGALFVGFGVVLFQDGFNGNGSFNPKDQHYYNPRETMVRGVVAIVLGAIWLFVGLRKQSQVADDNQQDSSRDDGSHTLDQDLALDKSPKDSPQRVWVVVRKWVMPSYDETTLFLMAVTCIALVVANSDLRGQIARCFDPSIKGAMLYSVLFGAMLLGGLLLSIVYVFTSKPASRFGKYLMCVFAMGVNGIGCVACGLEWGHSCQGWQMVFPIWNVVCGITLLYRIELIEDPEDMVLDGQPNVVALLFGLLLLAILFHYCHFVSHMSWALTFSICVAYSTSIYHVVRRFARVVISRSEKPA